MYNQNVISIIVPSLVINLLCASLVIGASVPFRLDKDLMLALSHDPVHSQVLDAFRVFSAMCAHKSFDRVGIYFAGEKVIEKIKEISGYESDTLLVETLAECLMVRGKKDKPLEEIYSCLRAKPEFSIVLSQVMMIAELGLPQLDGAKLKMPSAAKLALAIKKLNRYLDFLKKHNDGLRPELVEVQGWCECIIKKWIHPHLWWKMLCVQLTFSVGLLFLLYIGLVHS